MFFLASLFIFGAVYWILDIVINLLRIVFPISDAIVVAVFFLWSLVPIAYYVAKAFQFFEARKIVKVD